MGSQFKHLNPDAESVKIVENDFGVIASMIDRLTNVLKFFELL
jgi:hypothetical protein